MLAWNRLRAERTYLKGQIVLKTELQVHQSNNTNMIFCQFFEPNFHPSNIFQKSWKKNHLKKICNNESDGKCLSFNLKP